MKMTAAQFELMSSMFDQLLVAHGYTRDQIERPADLWRMFTLAMHQVSFIGELPNRAIQYRERPFGFGTHQDWLFPGLNDSHLKTAFKKYAPAAFKKPAAMA